MKMNVADAIARKRDGDALTASDIATLIEGYAQDRIPDYQMAALAMAICLQGMNAEETAALTDAMLQSGRTVAWSDDALPRVDKHSTGGVGDKVSIALAPLLACCDVCVPMISGRGLGATGGTLDKLESIAGFRTDLSIDEIQRTVSRVGCVITGATAEIAPADRKLYALRDVTATVPSLPLITASIMSKKLAEGLDALVLDVKFGSGAVIKSVDRARELARAMVATGRRMGVAASALLTDMNQPLGQMIGNAVEVDEVVELLDGRGPADLQQLVLALGGELLAIAGASACRTELEEMLQAKIASGEAMEKLAEMVAAQGGNLAAPRPRAHAKDWLSPSPGWVASIDGELLGRVLIELGGGRRIATDRIDPTVGMQMLVRLGDHVERGQPLLRIFASQHAASHVEPLLGDAIALDDAPPQVGPLILERIES